MSDQPVMTVEGLRVEYGLHTVLAGLDLHVMPGEWLAVVGLNGAGKSTLLKAVSGIIPVSGGQVRLRTSPDDWCDITSWPISKRLREGVMCPYMLQGGQVFGSLSVTENLDLAGHHLPRDHRASRLQLVQEAIPDVVPLLSRRAGLLSGGQRQRVAAAMVLLAADQPRVLLLDEPSAGIPEPDAFELLARLQAETARQGVAVVMVEQKVQLALRFASRMIVVRDGVNALEAATAGKTPDEVVQILLGSSAAQAEMPAAVQLREQ